MDYFGINYVFMQKESNFYKKVFHPIIISNHLPIVRYFYNFNFLKRIHGPLDHF